MSKINFSRIKKDCFWDLNISEVDIQNIISSDDTTRKKMLFEKILLNSTALFMDLKIFDIKEIETYLESYLVPRFNGKYAFRRKNIAEVYFLDKPLLIDELKWIA
ncbi:hypothetical protein [Poseidonibacter sp.]|uniref:hypothetical protein n=1 Tax=Poseidonibacter sp. TaxID=2321188 RepID=UPI003C787D95